MLEITFGDVEEQVVTFCQKWLNTFAEKDYKSALAEIDAPNEYGITWNKENIKAILTEYLGEGIEPKIESRHMNECNLNTIKRNDGGYSVEFDIPLNGEVSDLTAQLEFNKKGRVFEVVLHDIHVL